MILERINQVQGKLVRNDKTKDTYIDEDDPWLGILAVAAFEICSTESRLNGYSPRQSVFGRYMIPPIKHMMDWE